MWLRLSVIAGILALGVAAYAGGLLSALHPDSLRTTLSDAGAWGPGLFLVAFALGEIVAVPSVLFIIAAGLAWPLWIALPIAWLGSVLSALVVFLLSRYVGRDFVQARLPGRLRIVDSQLERGGVLAVALIRLGAFLAPWTHPALALSSVTARAYVIGTGLGVLPGVVGLVLVGEVVTRWFDAIPGWVWVVLIALIVVQLAYWKPRDSESPGVKASQTPDETTSTPTGSEEAESRREGQAAPD